MYLINLYVLFVIIIIIDNFDDKNDILIYRQVEISFLVCIMFLVLSIYHLLVFDRRVKKKYIYFDYEKKTVVIE